ncbi:MAG: prenyltransferase/squalene oxidase repeat-containing protein [Anaerolineae bacterium]|nr:hypothetical protein [Anaerolineae bacterium]
MLNTDTSILEDAQVRGAIQDLLVHLGEGRIDGTPYDTAWIGRLAPLYSGFGFDEALEWLRHHQHEDGTWGTRLPYYHDRYICTLAGMVALKEAGTHPRDERRVQRASDALWHLVGRLQQDGEDTVGFPVLSVSLSEEARNYDINVPRPPIRYGNAYKSRVAKLVSNPFMNWRAHPVTFSLDGLRFAIPLIPTDAVLLEGNNSVGISPSATAAYVMAHSNQKAVAYLQSSLRNDNTGLVPALFPIDIFEIAWAINHLIIAEAITPDDPEVQRVVRVIWELWSPEKGIATSSFFTPHDVDNTIACYNILRWAGYPVSADVLYYFEGEEFFDCYPGETHHSPSAHLRIMWMLRQNGTDHPNYDKWLSKLSKALLNFNDNGTFWWDKWHISPYYTNALALIALAGLDEELETLARLRLTWIEKTQNDDGGWGYYGDSTPEETAFCLEGLLWWDQHVERLAPQIIRAAGQYLSNHLADQSYAPMWISKCLYTPHYIVKSSIVSALYSYGNWEHK